MPAKASRQALKLQNLAQEGLRPRILRRIEELGRRGIFQQFAVIEEQHSIRDFPCKAQLVGDADQGHASVCTRV